MPGFLILSAILSFGIFMGKSVSRAILRKASEK